MMMDKLLKDAEAAEKIAHDILSLKNEVVSLDYKRNKNREALRAMSSEDKNGGNKKTKTWICTGNLFVKSSRDSTKNMIREDQESLEKQINEIRENIKRQTEALLLLEGKPTPPSMSGLKPLSKQEAKAMSGILPTVSGAEFMSK